MKEKKKISLTIYVLSLIMVAVVIIIIMLVITSKKENVQIGFVENKQQVVLAENIAKQEENTTKANQNTQNEVSKTEEDTKIDWEEYPSDIDKIFNELFFEGIGEEIKYLGKGEKMIYSIVNNKLYNDTDDSIFKNILYSYTDFAGDYFADVETETNYNQYDYLSENNTIEKYKDIINFKIAMFNSSRYQEYTEDGFLKDLTQKTKKQYEILKSENYNKDGKYYFSLEKIVVMNGNNTSKEDYKNNSRAKKIKVTVNNDEEYIFELKDTNKAQMFDLNYKQQTITKPIDILIEVLETYDGEKTQDIYISDIQFGVTTNISLGI